jgi:hypothetical protein
VWKIIKEHCSRTKTAAKKGDEGRNGEIGTEKQFQFNWIQLKPKALIFVCRFCLFPKNLCDKSLSLGIQKQY